MVACLVGMVIRGRMFVSMEGTLMGAMAMTCMGIWNGSFNSVQVICRERDIIKREQRSGMHVSSYVVSHMLYQALICLLQTGVVMYVTHLTGVRYFDGPGLFTPFRIADMGVSVFLISYAADMLSLWISALSRSPTVAMTVMPFVLIFQLVFSGGMLTLPAWSRPFTRLTISNYGLKALCAQADYNGRPLVTAWDTLEKMRDQELAGSLTLGQALDFLTDRENPAAAELRAWQIEGPFTLGEAADALAANPDFNRLRDRSFTFRITIGQALEMAGEDRVREFVLKKAAEASRIGEYEYTAENIAGRWGVLVLFSLAFALLSAVTLEFIDRDKR